jgi:hypothetical protein
MESDSGIGTELSPKLPTPSPFQPRMTPEGQARAPSLAATPGTPSTATSYGVNADLAEKLARAGGKFEQLMLIIELAEQTAIEHGQPVTTQERGARLANLMDAVVSSYPEWLMSRRRQTRINKLSPD